MPKLLLIALLAAGFASMSAFAAKARPSSPQAGASAEASNDKLSLRRADLLEKNDDSWFPTLPANPDDFSEDLEIPLRSQKDDSQDPVTI